MVTVLIVDDETDILDITEVSLEAIRGWRVLKARNARDGYELARSHKPDIILLDVMMPEVDGLAMYDMLQADASTRDIPVILLTALVQAADKRRYEAKGLHRLISKPFDPMSLAERIETILNGK